MSYSVDLWNSYKKLQKQLESHLNGLKIFIYIMSEYYSSQQTYSKELKRLSDYLKNNTITNFESLNAGIISFQTDLLNQHDYLVENLNNIKEEIITPLKQLKDKITKRLNNNLKEVSTCEKNYNNCMSNYENTKNQFHKSVKEVEQSELEINILKKEKYPQNKLTELEIKTLNLLKAAKEKENNYIYLINEANNIQEEYIETKKKNLNDLQDLEESIGLYIKDSLRKYIIYQVSYIKNFQYDIDKKSKIMENIDVLKDIKNFINKNETKDIPPFKIDYIPYLSELNKIKTGSKIDKDMINEINIFIENNFSINKEKELMILKNKNNSEIESISEEIFNSEINIEKFEQSKIVKIINYCKNKKNRRELLKAINNFRRIKGLKISDIIYDNIGKIINICLNDIFQNMEESIDYSSILMIFSLGSTLYKIPDNSEEKIFLNKYIKLHKIWKKYEIWKGLIKYSINEEMHNQKKYNLFSEENDILYNIRIKDIIKGQISINLYNMNLFEVNTSLMFKIINNFCNYYELQSNIVDYFNNIVKNYQTNLNETQKHIKITINNNSKNNIFFEEIKEKPSLTPVQKDEQIKNDNINISVKNIYQNDNINNKLKQEKKINNNDNIIYNEGNFGNILIKESKDISGIESDDDIIDESEINYMNNCT